mgnify:CR=1 FL=1
MRKEFGKRACMAAFEITVVDHVPTLPQQSNKSPEARGAGGALWRVGGASTDTAEIFIWFCWLSPS